MAAAHALPVRVLRATYVPAVYEELLLPDTTHADLLTAARVELERDAQLSLEVRERVPVTFEMSFGKAIDEIVRAGSHSSLLVSARRDPDSPSVHTSDRWSVTSCVKLPVP